MGAMAALLLGVAAGFVVLGIPIHLLETVTTATRLSRIMVQAEPPISPNDRTLLAVLAGILAAGIGWVLIDWLLFGRAGMRTLIREREDEYEEEEGDAFRLTDPLDLVAPVNLPTGDWASAANGDARRPLSVRTDIGDPPLPSQPAGPQPAPMPAIDQLLPPIDQILPGAMRSAPPPLVQPPGAHPFAAGAPSWPLPAGFQPDRSDEPVPVPVAPAAEQSAPLPSAWLPTPGVRPDGTRSSFDVPLSPTEAAAGADATPERPLPRPELSPVEPFTLTRPVPPLQFDASAPSMSQPPAVPPEAVLPPAREPLVALIPQPEAPPPVAFDPPPATAPEPLIPSPRTPPPPRPAAEAGFDKARLEDLLARLERGLQNRRAAAARAAAAAALPTPAPAPTTPPVQPRAPEPPVSYVQPQPMPQRPGAVMPEPPVSHPFAPAGFPIPEPVMPPAGYAAPQPVAPTPPPIYDLPPIPPSPAYNLAPLPQPTSPAGLAPSLDGRTDELLDQPLHVTLELLRNKVKQR